jgi:hypothetical protein
MAKPSALGLKISGTVLVSLVFAAAILPVMLAGVLNPQGLSLITRADEADEIRIWFEPAEVVTKPGVKFKLDVMADFESETQIIPAISAIIQHGSDLSINLEKVVYDTPFRGVTKIGTIEVKAESEGKFELGIDPNSVAVSLPDIGVVSAKTLITSKR